MATPRQLSVLTLNTWLLRTPLGIDLCPDIDDRARLLPHRIAELNPDLIILQEAWHPRLRRQLAATFEALGYPYSTHPAHERVCETPKSGILLNHSLSRHTSGFGKTLLTAAGALVNWFRNTMGNGLQIVSRYEISPKIDQMRFSVHTRPDETLVNKGAIRARVNLPTIGWADVYNSHLGAVTYQAQRKDFHKGECENRLIQTLELAKWIEQTRSSEFVILGTDLNTHYHEFAAGAYQRDLSAEFAAMICPAPYGLGLIDTFSFLNGIREREAYTDDSSNPYRNGGMFSSSPCGVLDYVFSTASKYLRPLSSRVVLRDPVNSKERRALRLRGNPRCVSDHYGVLTSFAL